MQAGYLFFGLAVISLVFSTGGARAVTTIGFDDFPIAAGSYWNGADGTGGFTISGATFSNTYNPAWGNWGGFAVSSVNDTNTPGYLNQYAVFSGTGLGGAGNYAVVYEDLYGDPNADSIHFAAPVQVNGFYINNTTYTALTLRDGDAWGFTKPFGGASGDAPDYFILHITGVDPLGQILGTNDFYLADYRFADNSLDYIVSQWTWIDLAGFGADVAQLQFSFSSSDTGMWGMNTPAYFAMDGLEVIPEPGVFGLMLAGLAGLAGWRRKLGLAPLSPYACASLRVREKTESKR